MLLNNIYFGARWMGASTFIRKGIGRYILIGNCHGRPEIRPVLAKPSLDKISAVIIFRHRYLRPFDNDILPVSGRRDSLYRSIQSRFGKIQWRRCNYRVQITLHLDHRLRHIARVFVLIHFDIQPRPAHFIHPPHCSRVAGIKVTGMKISFGRAITAMSLLRYCKSR